MTAGGTAATGPGTNTSGNVATNEIAVTTLITPATLTSSTLTIGGTLAPGTYYYRHWDIDSAAGGSCAGTVGSTLPSTQTSQVVPAGTSTNTVTLTLTASAAENAALVAGTTVETQGQLTVGASMLASAVTAQIISQYNAMQAGFAGYLLAGGYYWNGLAWTHQ
jgi:hypothetical protein